MTSEIKLPTSWEAVNLKQFAALQNKLQQEETDAIEKYIDIISILSNEKPSLIMKMPIDSLKKAIEFINFIHELPKETKIKNEFEINGQRYKGTIDITKLTAGQYIDIKTFCKDTENIFENLANIMAVIYIEEGVEYDGQKHGQRARTFAEKLSISDVYGFCLFFSKLLNDLTMDILDYTLQQQREILEYINLRDTMIAGDGLGY